MAFRNGVPLDELAQRHERGVRAIGARLERLGLADGTPLVGFSEPAGVSDVHLACGSAAKPGPRRKRGNRLKFLKRYGLGRGLNRRRSGPRLFKLLTQNQ